MPDSLKQECTGCGSERLLVFFENRNVPIYVNFLWKSPDAARGCPRGDIMLALCRDCGLIFNAAFDPWKLVYRDGYENSLHFSTVFQSYAEKLADTLIEQFDLRDKSIIEIGCGGGEFLSLLCERGPNTGLGFDPSPRTASGKPISDRVSIVPDYYSERYSDRQADFICSRHTLEHVGRPEDMLGPIRQSVGQRVDLPIFFEVPNARYMLENHFIWDIIYEHASYFTTTGLANAFVRAGFEARDIYETFAGQYLCITARAATKPVDATTVGDDLVALVESFQTAHVGYSEMWKTRLEGLNREGKNAVVWGAGSKGVMFVNSLDVDGLVEKVVDINPNKQGMFIAGSGQKIVAPESLTSQPPDTVIVANPVYIQEISEILHDQGVKPELIPL
ncbi:MAG: methyltransferase domain-containing protein [Candidatus Latescibacterota bacterium]|nr:MAG: methyltransferase domain-containing protein [Candidatus Latescibacterota bacterium]